MRLTETTKVDAGCLGAALRVSRYLFHLFLAFTALALLSMVFVALMYLTLGEAFLVSENFERTLNLIAFPVFAVGIGSVMLVAFAWWGFWYCRIAGLGINLKEVGQSLKSKLRSPTKSGPITLAGAFAGALMIGAVLVGIGTVVWWNERYMPGLLAVTAATIAVVVLALSLVQILPKMTERFYARRTAERDDDLILLLRAFKRDTLHTRNLGVFQPITLEGTVVHMLERYAQVIAVADPGHDVQPVGAERVPLEMAEWQKRVLNLMDKAAAIVIALDESPGIVWEFERATEGDRLKKAIFVVWSDEHAWPRGPWAQLARRLGIDAANEAVAAPSVDVALAAICVEDRIIIATAKASTPYTNALATMMLVHQSLQAR